MAPVAELILRSETFAPGLLKCGVLVKLNDSARNWTLYLSLNLNSRKRPKSHWRTPGPRRIFQPAVPKRASVTGLKARGSKYGCPLPCPPSISTFGFTRSARCELPGAFSEVPEEVTLNGLPLYTLIRLLTCQPPTIADTTPPLLNHRLPLPKGSSRIFVICRLCGRSMLVTARFR